MKQFLKFWLMALGLCALAYAIATITVNVVKFIYFLPDPFFHITVGILGVTGLACVMSMFNEYVKAKYPRKM